MKTVLWVVESNSGKGWEYCGACDTRSEARAWAASVRLDWGDKTRIVRFIREAA